jgi:hypothetical protein
MRTLVTYLQVRPLAKPARKLCSHPGCVNFVTHVVRYREGFEFGYRPAARLKQVCVFHLSNQSTGPKEIA